MVLERMGTLQTSTRLVSASPSAGSDFEFSTPQSAKATSSRPGLAKDGVAEVARDADMAGDVDGSESATPGSKRSTATADAASAQSVGNNDGTAQTGESEEAAGDQPPPAWSDLKTKAGKERKRLPLACIACRRKKIRCSGEKPACKHCLRSRIPCVYKVTMRRAAPRTDYMVMLDKRLKRMEERVIKIIPKEEQGIVKTTGRAVVKPALPPPPPRAPGQRKRQAETAFEEELEAWASAKPILGDRSKTERPGAAESSNAEKPGDAAERNLLEEGADKLPPKDVQQHLAEVYFDFVYGQSYFLLHKPSFMRKLGQGTVPPVLILAVCAISARFSSHPAVRTEPAFLRGESWAAVAREIALKRYDTPNITILIVYLLLGLHEFGTCQGGRSWMFGGMAQRMAYALQLHKDPDHDPKARTTDGQTELTFTNREIRRRTMWACFVMDRFNSSGTDRPTFVSEQYIKAQLPVREKYFQMEMPGPVEDLDGKVLSPVSPSSGLSANAKDNMGIAAYLIRLVDVWGKLIHYVNLGGKERDEFPMWDERSGWFRIKQAHARWLAALPEALHYNAENLRVMTSERVANHFIFLHIVYHQTKLFMYRFALPTPGAGPILPAGIPAEFVAEAKTSAYEAANAISLLVHEGMDNHVVAPFAGYAAFFSSTVHINGVFSQTPAIETASKRNLAYNVKYLTKLKKYWGMFYFVAEHLRDLYKRHAEAARSDAHDKKDGEQSRIFQYGDWFDRYPHGVSGADYEEPNRQTRKEPGADAVLGAKSDLQSVEEFFSKLSVPNRAESNIPENAAQKKSAIAKKRRTKSESKGEGSAADEQSKAQQQKLHRASFAEERNQTISAESSNAVPSAMPQRPKKGLQRQSSRQSQQYDPSPQPSPSDVDLFGSSSFPQMSAGMLPFSQQASSDFDSNMAQASPGPTSQPQQQQVNSQFNFGDFFIPSAQPFMAELDRQMVLNSYASNHLPSASWHQNTSDSNDTNNVIMLDDAPEPNELNRGSAEPSADFDFLASFMQSQQQPSLQHTQRQQRENMSNFQQTTANTVSQRQNYHNTQPQTQTQNSLSSSAWFMPFNMSPPPASAYVTTVAPSFPNESLAAAGANIRINSNATSGGDGSRGDQSTSSPLAGGGGGAGSSGGAFDWAAAFAPFGEIGAHLLPYTGLLHHDGGSGSGTGLDDKNRRNEDELVEGDRSGEGVQGLEEMDVLEG